MCMFSGSNGKVVTLPRRKWIHRNRQSGALFVRSNASKVNISQADSLLPSTSEEISFWDLSTLIVAVSIILTFTILAIVLAVYLDRKRSFRRKTIPTFQQFKTLKCGCQVAVYDEARKPGKNKGGGPVRSSKDVKTLPIVEFSRTRRPVIAAADLAEVIYETLDSKDFRQKKRQPGNRVGPLMIDNRLTGAVDATLFETTSQSSHHDSNVSQYDNPPCASVCKFCRSHSAPVPATSPLLVPPEYFQLENQLGDNRHAIRHGSRTTGVNATSPNARPLRHTQSVILHDRLPPLPPMRCPPRNNRNAEVPYVNIAPPPSRFTCVEGDQQPGKNAYFTLLEEAKLISQNPQYAYSRVSKQRNPTITGHQTAGESSYFVLENFSRPHTRSMSCESDMYANEQNFRLDQRRNFRETGSKRDYMRRMMSFDQGYVDRLKDRTNNSKANEGVTIVFLNNPPTDRTSSNLEETDDSTYDKICLDSSGDSGRNRVHSSPD